MPPHGASSRGGPPADLGEIAGALQTCRPWPADCSGRVTPTVRIRLVAGRSTQAKQSGLAGACALSAIHCAECSPKSPRPRPRRAPGPASETQDPWRYSCVTEAFRSKRRAFPSDTDEPVGTGLFAAGSGVPSALTLSAQAPSALTPPHRPRSFHAHRLSPASAARIPSRKRGCRPQHGRPGSRFWPWASAIAPGAGGRKPHAPQIPLPRAPEILSIRPPMCGLGRSSRTVASRPRARSRRTATRTPSSRHAPL